MTKASLTNQEINRGWPDTGDRPAHQSTSAERLKSKYNQVHYSY